MPCMGPSREEIEREEYDKMLARNLKLFKIKDTDLNIATRVACHLSKGEHNELTRAWTVEHAKQDALREQKEKQREIDRQAEALRKVKQEQIDAEVRQFRRRLEKERGVR